METVPREILICQDEDGREPFTEWLDSLASKQDEAIILNRIDRIEGGNFGDVRPVGQGVSELRIDFGPGYRVYFGQKGTEVHLLGGGTKKTQARDIESAKEFWNEHD